MVGRMTHRNEESPGPGPDPESGELDSDESTEASKSTLSEGYPGASQRLERSREDQSSPPEPISDPLEVLAEAERERAERERRLHARNLHVTESMLLEELEAYVDEERPRAALSYQVGVRLGREHWNRLLLVARWSGVAPTTMARILINRGTRALIDEELRYRRKFGPESD
jgi:hypothetical protein